MRRAPTLALSLVLALLVSTASAGLVNQWSFEEGSGINAADTVGGQHGELQPTGNPPVWSADTAAVPSGSAWSLQFDGSNDLVNALGYKGITGTDPRSVSAWIKTASEGNEPIISWGQNSGGQKWTFRVQDSNGPDGTIRVEVNGGYHVGTTYVADDQWHHAAVTWADDGSPNVNDSRLWVDGQLEGRGAVQGRSMNTASNANVRIGRAVNNNFFDGNLDEVRIYDEAVDRSSIRALAGLAPDPYFETVKAAAPVAYWRLGEPSGNRAFNEGSEGSTADGAYQNSPTLGQPGGAPGSTDPGTENSSALFNGSNERVEVGGYTGVTGTDPRTVSAWIKTDDSGDQAIVTWGQNQGGKKWNFRQDNDGTDGLIRVEVNGGYQVGTTNIADGEWHHVAATWEHDGVNGNVNDVRLWVDGTLEGISASQGQAIDTGIGSWVRIARDHENRHFNGGIDEVAIFDRAMSRSEIRALAGLAPDPYYDAVQANAPIGYWRLGEPSGGKAFNEGTLGAAVDGSYYNNPTQGQPSLVPTVTDTAVHFDSDDDHVRIPDNDGINTGADPVTQHSIESWFAVEENTRNRMVIYEQGGGTNGLNMYVQHDGDDHYLRYGAWTNLTGSQVNHFPDRVPIELDEAYHAVSVYNDATDDFFVYINGAPAGGKINANVAPIGTHTGNIAIGAKQNDTRFDNGGNGGTGNYFAGTIDEVAIYDAAVDLRSIQTHYVAGKGTPMALGLRKGTTLGVVLNYDASFDDDGNAAWEDTIGSRPFKDGQVAQTNQFDFALSGAPRVAVTSHLLPYITHAYEFDGNASATTREVDDVAGEPTRFSSSFEIVFKPSDFVGTEVVFDIGGNTDGSAIWLDGSVLHFDVKDNAVNARPEFDLGLLPGYQQTDFLHVIGVADLDNDQALLYVNGILRAAANANGDLTDWAGGNDLGLGSIGGNMAFAEQDPFIGQIALARIYGGQGAGLLSAADVAANLKALQPEPTTMALLGLGALALVRRRRRK